MSIDLAEWLNEPRSGRMLQWAQQDPNGPNVSQMKPLEWAQGSNGTNKGQWDQHGPTSTLIYLYVERERETEREIRYTFPRKV